MAQVHPGRKLRLLRESIYPPISQSKAATILQVTRNIVANWEANPPRSMPDQEILGRASEAWGKPVEWFFEESDLSDEEIIADLHKERDQRRRVDIETKGNRITITITIDI